MLWSRRPATHIQITHHFIPSLFLPRKDSFINHLIHYQVQPWSKLHTSQPLITTCNRVELVTVGTKPTHKKKQRCWWNLLAQTHWGRSQCFSPPLKASPVIYLDVQQGTNLNTSQCCPLWRLWEAGFTHTHRQHGSITLPGFRGRTRGEKTIRRRRSKGTQRERKWSGVKQQEVIYLGFVMCLEMYTSLRTLQKCCF